LGLVPCLSYLSSSTNENTEREKPFQVTWVTHSSRTSKRMVEYKIKKGEPIILNEQQEIEIAEYLSEIIKEKN